ncbi:hypothetical protein BK011_06945 [Tenericutes bacterium MZ-XQ]|jgi:hypothetical protein|nr:hypothetical protein BK011_06945 [Tenericutes bacterium MZ-XQ]
MINQFELVHVGFKYLLSVMGESKEQAIILMDDYLDETHTVPLDRFTFELVITQGSMKKSLHVAYAAVSEKVSISKQVQLVELNSDLFLKVYCPKEDYNDLLEGKYNKTYESYLKEQGLKINFSKIYGLMKSFDDGYEIYFNCKS